MKETLFIIIFFVNTFANAQLKIEILQKDEGNLPIRGLSVVSENVFWVSGNNGRVGRSVNGGKTISWQTVKGFEKADFRDIHAFDSTSAIIMAISEPAYLLKTNDAGKNWKIVYENPQKGMFLDAMDFANKTNGIVVGDAINGKIFLAKTLDSGNTWYEIEQKPIAIGQEGCFASSGTNVVYTEKDILFVTGGLNSRFFKNGKALKIPIINGAETRGANSIAISKNRKNLIIVGGDFKKIEDTTANCVISNDAGKNFRKSIKNPFGYRSCVAFISNKKAITCGLNGVDISVDKGLNWLNISKESFHVCQVAPNSKVIYFAGNNGRIGKILAKKL